MDWKIIYIILIQKKIIKNLLKKYNLIWKHSIIKKTMKIHKKIIFIIHKVLKTHYLFLKKNLLNVIVREILIHYLKM